jgi:hypothetical protein
VEFRQRPFNSKRATATIDHVQEGQTLAMLEVPEMEDDLAKAAAVIDEANASL